MGFFGADAPARMRAVSGLSRVGGYIALEVGAVAGIVGVLVWCGVTRPP